MHVQSPEPSLLSRLRAPQLAEIGRKRSVHRNNPPKGKRPSKGRGHLQKIIAKIIILYKLLLRIISRILGKMNGNNG